VRVNVPLDFISVEISPKMYRYGEGSGWNVSDAVLPNYNHTLTKCIRIHKVSI